MAEMRPPETLGLENNNHNDNRNYNTLNNNYSSSSLTSPVNQLDSYDSTPLTAVRVKEKRIDFIALKGAQRTPKTAKASRKSKVSPMSIRPLTPGQSSTAEDRDREIGAALAVEIDMQRMQLISPPPEEVLNLRRHSRLGSVGTSTPGAATPRPARIPAVETPATVEMGTTTKRKRNQHHATPSRHNDIAGSPMDIDGSDFKSPSRRHAHPGEHVHDALPEATPNPKPRKIRHIRTQSVESPTKARFPKSVVQAPYREQFQHDTEEDSEEENHINPPSSSQTSSPRKKGAATTTPTKPPRNVMQSPYVKNPEADWLPPVSALTLSSAHSRRAVLGARNSRRSETPIPPYEPPTDVFTPPREVFLSTPVAVSKSAKRKTKAPSSASKAKSSPRKSKAALKVTTGYLKQEIPNDIDLLAPMPPPSPSDDPLLLSGPPEEAWESSPLRAHVRRRASARNLAAMAKPETIQEVTEDDDVLPPSSPEPPLDSEDMRVVDAFNWDAPGSMDSPEDSMMRVDPGDEDVEPVVLFGFGEDEGVDDDGGWTDSDTEMEVGDKGKGSLGGLVGGDFIEEGEGEYTGRWRTMLVRTKMDPPSSATRERQDQWGHPISPYPKIKGKRLTFVGEDEEQPEHQQEELEAEEPSEGDDDQENASEDEGGDQGERAIEEEEEEEGEEGEEDDVREEQDTREEEEVLRMSVEPEEYLDASIETEDEAHAAEAPFQDALPAETPTAVLEPEPEVEAEDEDFAEEQEVQQISIEMEDEEEDNAEVDLSQFNTPTLPPSPLPPSPVHNEEHQEPVADVDIMTQTEAAAEGRVEADDGGDDDTSVDVDEPGFVKITSSDPRAAARAAAILKQHDYECYTKLRLKRRHSEIKQRRASSAGVEDLAKELRRRDLASSAITKSTSKSRRKSTLGISVIGETVYIPGTPATTLPALLQEAEAEVVRDIEHVHAQESPRNIWNARAMFEGEAQKDLYKTPMPDRRLSNLVDIKSRATPSMLPLPVFDSAGERVWTKDEWKQLDACFTDQRLDIGATLAGANEETLAPVEMVRIDDVVERFIALMGGVETVEKWGSAWSREDLLERARALDRKQRSGHGARPSTPRTSFSFTSPRPSTSIAARPVSNIEVPDFTPLVNRRYAPHPRKSSSLSRPILPPAVLQSTPFSNFPPEKERSAVKIPKSLLAPRYSHLLEEAIAISQEGQFGVSRDAGEDSSFTSTSCPQDQSQAVYDDDEDEEDEDEEADIITHTPALRPTNNDVPPSTIGTRVKGFLFSYLPRLSKTSSVPTRTRNLKPSRPGLPLPPPDVLSKQRGPVTTPARPPIPKAKAPKELVELHHAPSPLPKSGIPRPALPKRLVELKGVGMPVEKPVVQRETRGVRPRRSSGSSVKDLVRGFENMSQKGDEGVAMKRTKSVNEMRKAWKATQPDTRPKWR